MKKYFDNKTEQVEFFIHRLHANSVQTRSDEARLPVYGMIYLTDGKVVVEVGGEPFFLRGGSLLLIPPAMPFAIRHFDGIEGVSLAFSERFLKDVSHPVLHSGAPSMNSWFQDDARFIGGLFERICDAWAAQDIRKVKSLLDLILCHIHADITQGGSAVSSRFLDDIFNVGEHLGSIAEYADRYGISSRWLSNCVRTYSNRAPGEWIAIARISRAKELLARTDLPIIDVASRVGLDDQSYFSRFFKKQVGVTPRIYRRMNSEKS